MASQKYKYGITVNTHPSEKEDKHRVVIHKYGCPFFKKAMETPSTMNSYHKTAISRKQALDMAEEEGNRKNLPVVSCGRCKP